MFSKNTPIFDVLSYNPVLWLDAFNPNGWSDSSWPANNASIATWKDKSSSANDATQATGANQPTFVWSSLNNKPAMVFNGSSQYFINGTGNIITGQAMTLLFVATATNIISTARPCLYPTRRNNDTASWQFELGSNTNADSAGITSPTNTVCRTAANSITTSPSIFTYRRDVSLTNNIYVNRHYTLTSIIQTNISFSTNSSTKLIGQGNGLLAVHYFT